MMEVPQITARAVVALAEDAAAIRT
jgi:hypothetical protein